MLISERINITMEVLDEVVEKIYISNKGWSMIFNDEVENVIKLLDLFYNVVPALNNMGLDFDRNILVDQINDMKFCLNINDYMRLADVLKYEVKESLLALKELIEAGVIKNEELL